MLSNLDSYSSISSKSFHNDKYSNLFLKLEQSSANFHSLDYDYQSDSVSDIKHTDESRHYDRDLITILVMMLIILN